ncbi:MAG TPA: hypothetical protein VG735_11410 [Caulobacterales bacterium]|nr:hypothetical protein [Caulobacterales bacterium]
MTVTDALFSDAVDRLKETVLQGRSIDAAQVQVIGLDDIRKAAGADWEKIKDRVRANSMTFLQGCLQRTDIVIPAGDGFLVIFSAGDERNLASECATVREALNAFYLGDAATARLKAEISQTTLDPRGVAALLRAPQAKVAAPARAAQHRAVFAPAWNAATQALTTYVCKPAYEQGGSMRFGYNPGYRTRSLGDRGRHGELDLRLLETAVQGLTRCLSEGRVCAVGVSIHPSTMTDRSARQALLARLLSVPENTRRYIAPQIAEIEPGTPLMTITDWVGMLRTACKRVTIELHPAERSLDGLGMTGALAVACSIPAGILQRGAAEFFGRWVGALHRQKVKLIADNLNDIEVLDAAITAGVDVMTSPRFWPPCNAPRQVSSYPREMLTEYRQVHI